MMVRTRRADTAAEWGWLRDLVSYWPVLLATLTIVAFILNAQRDIADLKLQVVAMTVQTTRLQSQADTLKEDGQFRDYVLCELLQTLHPKENLPMRCQDAFKGWGLPR